MNDELSLGPVPTDEECIPAGTDPVKEREECQRFITRIKEHCGEPPTGARLKVKSNPHDFGSYLDVVVVFSDQIDEAVEYAFWAESHTPRTWSSEETKEVFTPKSKPVYKDQYGDEIHPELWHQIYNITMNLELVNKIVNRHWIEYRGMLFVEFDLSLPDELAQEFWSVGVGETLKYWINWHEDDTPELGLVTSNLCRWDSRTGFYHA